MDSFLLSRLTKDFLNLDADLVPARDRYRKRWSGSVLSAHREAIQSPKKSRAERLLELKERFSQLFIDPEEIPPIPLSTSPRLAPPKEPPPSHLAPPWYFSRGVLEKNRKKNPEPILHLLMETTPERVEAKPVPGNSYLFRSLCRGKGILKRKDQGLVYLDVDNRFISMMLPYLKAQGLARPPYFNLFDSPEGAHIPVITVREVGFHYLTEIEGLGMEFSFEVEGLYSVQSVLWPEVEQVWFFRLFSLELEALRQRHCLTDHPGGHPFHIVVAVRPKLGQAHLAAARSMPLMRTNSACLSKA